MSSRYNWLFKRLAKLTAIKSMDRLNIAFLKVSKKLALSPASTNMAKGIMAKGQMAKILRIVRRTSTLPPHKINPVSAAERLSFNSVKIFTESSFCRT